MENILNLKNVSAGYNGLNILNTINLSIKNHEKILLIGPNGCGKSTLLKTIAGVIQPISGEITYKNEIITEKKTEERVLKGIGYLYQENNIFPSLTVESNLSLAIFEKKKACKKKQIDKITDFFPSLKAHLKKRAGQLSGGERQALAICMVLLKKSDLILLDEPTAGLSPKAVKGLLERLKYVQEKEGFSFIIVEHSLNEVQDWVDKAIIMVQGEIIGIETNLNRLTFQKALENYYF